MLPCCIRAAPSWVWICAASSFSSCLLSSGASFRSPTPLLTLMIWLREQPAAASASRSRIAIRKSLRGMCLLPHFQAPTELRVAPRAVHHLSFQLPAGCVNVVAAGTPHHRLHIGIQQDFLERANRVFVRAHVLRSGERIERNQVHLGRQP